MSIVRVGSTGKYSDGWETAFGKKRRKSTSNTKKKSTKKTAKKTKRTK